MVQPDRLDILADVGGTNARFALFDGTRVGTVVRLPVRDFADPASAIRTFLDKIGPDSPPRRAALAIAWALPSLTAADACRIGGGSAQPGGTIAVMGPGTGLGVAGFMPSGKQAARVLTTEGGHVTLPAVDDREAEIIACLRRQFGHVSAERLLSGEGLINLYGALATVDGVKAPPRNAAEISGDALSGHCALCLATLDAFCAFLGSVAGNLALSLGARGGLYIAGGIVPRFADYLAASRFRERFLAKGRFRAYLEEIPTQLITHPDPAFLGLANTLKDR